MEHANTDTAGTGAIAKETLEQLIAQARAEGNPWAQAAGIFKDDPLFDEFVEAMRENWRNQDEAESLFPADADDPARRFAGILRANPLYEQWQETMRDFRRQADSPSETR